MKSVIGCKGWRKKRNPTERLKRVGLLRTSERSGETEYGGLWGSIGLRGLKGGLDTGSRALNGPWRGICFKKTPFT